MKLLFVINNYYVEGNGICASARRTVGLLRKAGMEVRLLSGKNPVIGGPQPDYPLEDYKLPFFDSLCRAHGYKFAKSDRKTICKAVQWADVIHLDEPFGIQMTAAKIAREIGKPCTATYHFHPENMTASIGLARFRMLNSLMLKFFQNHVYDFCTHVQCPTENVRERLEKFSFASELHVISNGITSCDISHDAVPAHTEGPFRVICVGRLAKEKDQMTLLKAMRHSRYAKNISLFFAGRGPCEHKYRKVAESLVRKRILSVPPQFAFLDKEGLSHLAEGADLYIHCATVEVEGLSCLEVIRHGVVPVIAEGELTATAQFALDPRSTFPERDAKTLAERIDYWLGRKAERERMAGKYAESVHGYEIDDSISSLIEMFEKAWREGCPSTASHTATSMSRG